MLKGGRVRVLVSIESRECSSLEGSIALYCFGWVKECWSVNIRPLYASSEKRRQTVGGIHEPQPPPKISKFFFQPFCCNMLLSRREHVVTLFFSPLVACSSWRGYGCESEWKACLDCVSFDVLCVRAMYGKGGRSLKGVEEVRLCHDCRSVAGMPRYFFQLFP